MTPALVPAVPPAATAGHVLVADDDPSMVQLLTELLTS
jgi:hypothetical protein